MNNNLGGLYGRKVCFYVHGNRRNHGTLVGGKGANLGQMTKLGLPIPQGFTVSTEACTYYYQNDEKLSGRNFGDKLTAL